MTAAAALKALRAVGGDVFLTADGRPVARAPKGLVPGELRRELQMFRDPIREIILGEQREHRLREVTRAFTGVNDRLSAIGPWRASELVVGRDLAEAVDREAKLHVDGETPDPARFLAALESWEGALRTAKGAANATIEDGSAPGGDE